MLFTVNKHLAIRGFSLVEVLISVFILGIAAVIYVTSTNTITLTRQTRFQDIAVRVASQKLATLRAAGYANLGAGGSFSDQLLSSLPAGSASTTISVYNANMKQVTVGVSWKEVRKTERYLSETTLIVDNGGL